MERPTTRRGVRRRPANDDEEIAREMPPNKKALVDLLENLCISMSSNNNSAAPVDGNRSYTAATFMSTNGPRQFVYPRRSQQSIYSEYMYTIIHAMTGNVDVMIRRKMNNTAPKPPRDPSLGAMVLYNTSPTLPSPLRRGMMMDVDMDSDDSTVQAPSQPRLAGNLTHGEWFLPEDDEDDAMDIMDML
ncbi:hypothetical protein, variant 1 [Aphanomyces astaci]|uniref:Uncharacterized protein n=1 Tax=Aphanomyces astaci TaxID=112090 RepID=W4GPI5_APHAT|nr:hypothetical protein, variant 1 [Aphanomyces astaci]ETV81246.1 hypothetical protein, variant 1 [Aphanomyces astaci]|eukprot:XP_009829104.1 hypothetical protein, variant 1 [Aphanomyces astaci]